MGENPSRRKARLEVTPLEDRLLCSAELIIDTKPEPFRSVGKVIAWWDVNHTHLRDNGEVFEATAAVIGPRAALTSAHVVYDSDLGGFATQISFLPGDDGGRPPFGTYRARSWVIPGLYLHHPYAGDDLAVLNFTQDVGKRTGWFNWRVDSASSLRHARLSNIGYPGDTHSGEQQYFSEGRPLRVTGTEVLYPTSQLPVEHGSSGSPLYVTIPATGERDIVGVHSRRIDNGAVGLSARITSLLADFILSAEHVRHAGGLVDSHFGTHPADKHAGA